MLHYKVIANRAKCLKCEDIIESKHLTDLVMCKCGSCYVDGGTENPKQKGFSLLSMSVIVEEE